MWNIYHKEIVDILLSCGKDGMKVSSIAKRVYNLHADFFEPDVTYKSIDKSIGIYLWRMCRKRQSIFRRNEYGIYSIKPDMAVQLDFFLDLKYDMEEEYCIAAEPSPDEYGKAKAVQLSLFEDK